MAADGADPTVQECVREGFGKISECKSVGNSEPFLSWFAAFRAGKFLLGSSSEQCPWCARGCGCGCWVRETAGVLTVR